MASQARINANRRKCTTEHRPEDRGRQGPRPVQCAQGRQARQNREPGFAQENAIELDQRINKWLSDLKPRYDAERELVTHAANLSWELERARRCETARLAQRVRRAQLKATKKKRIQEVGELSRRLLYQRRSTNLAHVRAALGR